MSPLSLRNHLVPPIGEDFGAYYTRELTYHNIQPGRDFWEVAREAKHQLNQILTDGKIYAGALKVIAFLSTTPDAIASRAVWFATAAATAFNSSGHSTDYRRCGNAWG